MTVGCKGAHVGRCQTQKVPGGQTGICISPFGAFFVNFAFVKEEAADGEYRDPDEP